MEWAVEKDVETEFRGKMWRMVEEIGKRAKSAMILEEGD